MGRERMRDWSEAKHLMEVEPGPSDINGMHPNASGLWSWTWLGAVSSLYSGRRGGVQMGRRCRSLSLPSVPALSRVVVLPFPFELTVPGSSWATPVFLLIPKAYPRPCHQSQPATPRPHSCPSLNAHVHTALPCPAARIRRYEPPEPPPGEPYVLRPLYSRGREIWVYDDTTHLHSTPDRQSRQSLWRFM
jgi:hypothetical protein